MKPGTKVKITNGCGIPDKLVGRVGFVTASSINGDERLIGFRDGAWWIHISRLEEVEDDE